MSQKQMKKEEPAERAALKCLAAASLVEDAKSRREKKKEKRKEVAEGQERNEVRKMGRELPAVAAAALGLLVERERLEKETEEIEEGMEKMELSE